MLFVSHPPSFETLIPYSVVLSLSLPRARDLLQQKGERFIFTRENKSVPIFLTGKLSYTSLTDKDFAAFSRHKKIQRQF